MSVELEFGPLFSSDSCQFFLESFLVSWLEVKNVLAALEVHLLLLHKALLVQSRAYFSSNCGFESHVVCPRQGFKICVRVETKRNLAADVI